MMAARGANTGAAVLPFSWLCRMGYIKLKERWLDRVQCDVGDQGYMPINLPTYQSIIDSTYSRSQQWDKRMLL